MKIGLIDVGGGSRDIYGAGILDYCLDENIIFNYCIGISAGSANVGSYLAGQRGRNYMFYMEYFFRKEYVSFRNVLTKGSYVDLDYPYYTLSKPGGENPLEYDKMINGPSELIVAATNALTGEAKYFDKKDIVRTKMETFKASSCLPIISKTVYIDEVPYFDGGLANPIPLDKAFEDGCDKVVLILTRPKDQDRIPKKDQTNAKLVNLKFPKAAESLQNRAKTYNESLAWAKELEKEGRVLILAPENIDGLKTLTKDKERLEKLYQEGYRDASKIKEFIGKSPKEYTYGEVIDKIENTHRFGNKPGVEVTASMLKTLGIEMDIPFAHVAGTNGKGSVCAFLGNILGARMKTGVFTSPHLVDFEERIRVNGQLISKEDVTRLGNILLNTDFDVTPTYFDYCLAMAIMYFREQGCDFAVIETGLGGLLDSTNCLGIPGAAVITKIGFDHMAILGDTLSKIASEKAGIIKKGSFVVIESQEEEAKTVFDEKLSKLDIKTGEEAVFITEDDCKYTKDLGLKMLGTHQYENAAAAMKAAEYILKSRGISDDKARELIDQGLKDATWMGRLQIISKDPFVIVDGAHNGHGVMALRRSLEELFPGEKFSFYMAVMADKDYENMIEEILPLANDFTAVSLENSRAAQSQALADFISERGIKAKTLNRVSEIARSIELKNFGENAGRKSIIFGSLYFVGDVLKEYSDK